jgi:pimeloyl-ACP methyl ester carboxylesterase
MKLLKSRLLLVCAGALLVTIPAVSRAQPASPAVSAGQLLWLADRTFLFPDGKRIAAQEGALLVRENRAKPQSRLIAVHFWRVKSPNPTRPPMMVLSGGPGSTFLSGTAGDPGYNGYGALETSWAKSTIDLAIDRSDVIFVNQRGNAGVPFTASINYVDPELPLDRLITEGDRAALLRKAVASAQTDLKASGADLRGYDIVNIADDVDEIRSALGYPTMMLTGGSFGSQWSFAVLRRHPDTVDRLMLDGIEPLGHAYDSPAHVEGALKRVMDAADLAPALAAQRPAGGFYAAFARASAFLRANPQQICLAAPDGTRTVVHVDERDLAAALLTVDATRPIRTELAALPGLLVEAEQRDFRRVAAMARTAREGGAATMIGALIDSSLGISADRDARLVAEAEKALVGDVNRSYRALRGTVEVDIVPDSFRAFAPISKPILLVQGTFDFSTPVENAREQFGWLKAGTLVEIEGGTHNVLNEALQGLPDARLLIRAFLAGERVETGEVRMSLPPIPFQLPPIKSQSDGCR